jgi:glutathione S-transferase
MILYLAPGACSLADHIALNEAGLAFDQVKVDLKTHRTEDGHDYAKINPKGYVPALALDSGEMLTENVAILSWIADQSEKLAPRGPLGRYRLLEALAYISTEIHKSFKPFFTPGTTEDAKAAAGQAIVKRLTFLAERLKDDYLLGPGFSVADAYLFVMLMWARKNGLSLPNPPLAYVERIKARPAVRRSLEEEKLA